MLRALFLFLIFICVTSFAKAQIPSCSEVDLNKDKQSPLNKIPVYDQDGSGLCYAYAASQMIDYYRFKNGDTSYDLTNPVYAGWTTYYKGPKYFKANSLQDGGFSEDVVKALKKHGVCTNQDVKKEMKQFSSVGSEPEVLKFLEAIYENYDGWFANRDWRRTSDEISKYTNINCDQQNDLKTHLQKKGLFSVAPTEILSKLFKDCKTNEVRVPDLESFSYGADSSVKEKMDGALGKNLPAQVDLCSKFFKEPSYRGLRGWSPPLMRASRGNSKSDCGIHAVVVTGRLNINGSCHYLVRNSWGSYWKPEGAAGCACRTTKGAYKQICTNPSEVAEYVGCWFDQKNMLPNTGGVSVFK